MMGGIVFANRVLCWHNYVVLLKTEMHIILWAKQVDYFGYDLNVSAQCVLV